MLPLPLGGYALKTRRSRCGMLFCQPPASEQGGRRAVDYIEFRKTMCEKYAKDEERHERRLRRRRQWLYPSLILFAVIVLSLIAFGLAR